MKLAKRVGAHLALLRDRSGETQGQIASATGYSRSSIANIEAGAQQLGLQSAMAFADHFRVPLDYLLCRSVPPAGPPVGEFIENPDALALVDFWRGLDDHDRQFAIRFLRIPGPGDL